LFAAIAIGFAADAHAQAVDRASTPALHLPGEGTVRALVAGIDHYPNLSERDQLGGAAADAQDIEAALRRVGVKDIAFLLDTAVTRAAFTAAMEALIKNARTGDLVIITFAGHGMQENERVPGSKPDGKNEEFVLSLMGNEGPETAERIYDDEIFAWLKRLAAKGAEIIFVADSCHGGGMTKATSRGSVRRGVRGLARVYNESEAGPGALYIAPGNDKLSVPGSIPPADLNATSDIPSLTFLAGVDASSEVVETTIGGRPRGALSYAFARAVDGSKFNGDITRQRLFESVRQMVLQLTQHQQSPVIEPRTAETAKRVLFQKAGGAPSAEAVNTASPPEAKIVTLEGSGTAPAPAGLYAFWDRATGDVISETRTVLAYGVPQSALPAVAKRVGTTAALAEMAAQAPLPVSLSPDSRDFASGQKFNLNIEGIYGRYLIILNLAGNGEVEYLFPIGNADPMMMQDRLAIPMHAEPPFGTDTLIILASKNRQPTLELDLSLLDKQLKPNELLNAIRGRLGSSDLLGIISYSTHP
jgi:hypothetical protein